MKRLFCIVWLALIIVTVGFASRPINTDDLYAMAFRVIDVERDADGVDLVTIKSGTGHLFQFTAEGSDWCVGDGCACVMDMNGTPEIYDDVILSARYFA